MRHRNFVPFAAHAIAERRSATIFSSLSVFDDSSPMITTFLSS